MEHRVSLGLRLSALLLGRDAERKSGMLVGCRWRAIRGKERFDGKAAPHPKRFNAFPLSMMRPIAAVDEISESAACQCLPAAGLA
jgi:hypothetical protein